MRGALLVACILALHMASAAPTLSTPDKIHQPGETILGKIENAHTLLAKITDENFKFFEGRKSVFFETESVLHNGTYYFYTYTTREGNFTLKLGPLLYTEGGVTKEISFEKNITIKKEPITENNLTGSKILSIRTGFIDFSKSQLLKFTNQGDFPLDISYNKETITLNKSASHEMMLEAPETFEYFKIKTYEEFQIPLLPHVTNTTILPRPRKLGLLTASNASIDLTVASGKETSFKIALQNDANNPLNQIKLTSDISFVSFSPTLIETLNINETARITIEINAQGRGNLRKDIEATYKDGNETGILKIPLTLLIVPKGFDASVITRSPLTCEAEGGKACGDNQFCSGNATYTEDGVYCCLASCIEAAPEEESSSGLIIGIILLAVLGLIIWFTYRKQKKLKAVDPLKAATQKYTAQQSGSIQKKK